MAAASFVPRFRAEHVGSLLRPRRLTQAFRAFHAGELSAAAYGAVQDACIEEAVALQERVGLQVVTDGEFRRGSYWGHFVDALEGMATRPALFDFHDGSGAVQPFIAPHVAGRLARKGGISTGEFAFLKSATRVTPKVTLPSPPTMHFWRGRAGIEPGAYAGAEALFADLARIFRDELADLARLGCTYVQIDEVPLAMLCDPEVQAVVARRGDDPAALVGLYIRAINDALTPRPPGMTVGLHMCRGNFKGKWLSEGGYDAILLSHVFEHVTDHEQTLASLHELLAPGGRLFIECPNVKSLRARLSHPTLSRHARFDERYRAFPIHLSYFTPKTLTDLLRRCGFDVVESTTWGFGIEELVLPAPRSPIADRMSTPKLAGAPERPAHPLKKLAKSVLTKLILEPGLGENIVVVARADR